MIGLTFTSIPGMLENGIGLYFETDGEDEGYWTCPGAEYHH